MGSDPTEYRPVAPKLDGSSTISESQTQESRLRQAERLRNDIKLIAA
jgi:hypothetical protein